jgi:hypothetical protein
MVLDVRRPTGIANLDGRLHGGLPRASLTAVAGAPAIYHQRSNTAHAARGEPPEAAR